MCSIVHPYRWGRGGCSHTAVQCVKPRSISGTSTRKWSYW